MVSYVLLGFNVKGSKKRVRKEIKDRKTFKYRNWVTCFEKGDAVVDCCCHPSSNYINI